MEYLDWVQAIYNWQYNPDGNEMFAIAMIYAYRGADPYNKRKLIVAFPELYQAMGEWDNAGDNGNDLFRELGVGKFREKENTKKS